VPYLARLALICALASIALAGCGGRDNGGTPAVPTSIVATSPGEVVIQNIAFNPETISVQAGGTVTWRFDDGGVPHTVSSDANSPAAFDSGQLATGTFPFRFKVAGRYPYHCNVHKKMHGVVTVT
jgi:plastocyanin